MLTPSQFEKDSSKAMDQAIAYFKEELRGVRTGRATPGLVEHVKVEVPSYGGVMELRELASISAPEPTLLLIKPFDPAVLKDIEKGIQASDVGITPMTDGKTIRLPIPPLSGERRNQMIAQVKKMAEAQKVAVRNVRRDVNKLIDTAEKDKKLTEDDAKTARDLVQKATKKHEDQIDELVTGKTKEIQEG